MNTETHTIPNENARRNGKVARLPKKLRDLVNSMLDDGKTYPEIIAALEKSTEPPLPWSISPNNLSNWFDGGYQDWLKQRESAELFAFEMEHVEELLSKTKADEIPDLLIKLAAARFCSYVKDLAPDRLHATTEEDPTNLIRLLSLLPRFSREALRTRKFRRSVQREETQEIQQRDPNKPFGDESDHRAVVDIVDQVLGLGKYRRNRLQQIQPATGAPVSNRPSEEDSNECRLQTGAPQTNEPLTNNN